MGVLFRLAIVSGALLRTGFAEWLHRMIVAQRKPACAIVR
jgi:hypothetical protein